MSSSNFIVSGFELTKDQGRSTRLRLEADGLAATTRLRNLYESLRDKLFQTATSGPGMKRLDGLAESLSRLGMIEELDALDELMQVNFTTKKTGVYSKWYVDKISKCRMEALVARRDYDRAMQYKLSKTERSVLLRGVIYQGDLDDAHAMLQQAVKDRESPNTFSFFTAVYSAGRLAIVAHWRGDQKLVDSSLQIMRCFIEQQPLSTRPLDEGVDWIPSELGLESYFIVTLASSGYPQLAEELWNRFVETVHKDHSRAIREYLAIHLAMAGETQRALRVAMEDYSEVDNPIWLWKPRCYYAARTGDVAEANRLAEEFFCAIRKRGTEQLHWTFKLLLSFIQWMQQAGQPDLARRAVELYIEITDRCSGEFEGKKLSAFVREAQPHFVEFAEIIDAEQLSAFAHRQYQTVIQSLNYHVPYHPEEWRVALARIGEIPPSLGRLPFHQQIPFIITLIESGRHDEALQLYRVIADWARKPLSADPDSPNNAGKVTQARYAIPQLGPYFDDVELAMECIEKLQASDPTTDYRQRGAVDIDDQLNTRIPRSLAKAKGIEAATGWAESLDNQDQQLQACVILLNMATEHIGIESNHERTPIAVELKRIDPWHMVFPGGC